MRLRRFLFAALATIFAGFSFTGTLANTVQREFVQATLLSETATVRPGDRFWVALRQEIKPDWHTYWVNPGDSGIPTAITWTLPPGAQAGPIVWPAPIRFSLGDLVNFGYANEAWLLTEITAPADALPGSKLDVMAEANWLACAQVCVPEEASLTLTVPVADETRLDADAAAGFAKARAALPQPAPWSARYAATKDGYRLLLGMPKEMAASLADAFVFAEQPDALENGAPQKRRTTADGLVVELRRGVQGLKPGEKLTGVVELTEGKDGGQVRHFAFAAEPAATGAAIGSSERDGGGLGFSYALLLAFAGGLILNLMPCVFPILSMKAMGMFRLAANERRAARAHGVFFGMGVLVSFAATAGILIALRAIGLAAGWGFQLQTPWFVLFLSYLMFALGLNLSGLVPIGGGFMGAGGALTAKPGKLGAFFNGVLAVLVATPCTAPFMGAALGFALTQPALPALAVFLALGAGMAMPYVLLSSSPALLRRLPKPGPWMERFRQLLAFPMYITAAWLVWVLAQQSPTSGIALALGGFILIGFAAWLLRQMDGSRLAWRRAYAVLAIAALAGALSTLRFVEASAAAPVSSAAGAEVSNAEPWSAARVEALRAEGRPVLVNFTAAWCITCLVNEKVALNTAAVRNALKAKNVAYLKGDWTRQDPAITAALASFGRSGVPLYVLYPATGEPIILPQILTKGGVLAELDRI